MGIGYSFSSLRRLASLVRRVARELHLFETLLRERSFIETALRDRPFVETAWGHRETVSMLAERAQAGTDDERRAIREVLRLLPYAIRAVEERYWLESALERKDFVMRALDTRRADEKAMEAFDGAFEAFRQASEAQGGRLPVRREDIHPQLHDATTGTAFDRHYLYHPAWAARILARTRPAEHVDISSILHFSTLLSAFVPTRFYDFRPAAVHLDGLTTGAADLLSLPFEDGSVASLSCMHVLEHIGLGRYGDPLDPDGDLKAIRELVRVLAPGGNLLVATPVGAPRVQFNAHRVYDHERFAEAFAPLELIEFALIPEHGEEGLVVAPPPERARAETYGCGCFWLRKPFL